MDGGWWMMDDEISLETVAEHVMLDKTMQRYQFCISSPLQAKT